MRVHVWRGACESGHGIRVGVVFEVDAGQASQVLGHAVLILAMLQALPPDTLSSSEHVIGLPVFVDLAPVLEESSHIAAVVDALGLPWLSSLCLAFCAHTGSTLCSSSPAKVSRGGAPHSPLRSHAVPAAGMHTSVCARAAACEGHAWVRGVGEGACR